ncbi:MAG TPA: hypothetical protein VF755_26810 [Catenuloplanes sp.]|jgi:hypothetical protein
MTEATEPDGGDQPDAVRATDTPVGREAADGVDTAEAPLLAGDDVRPGPEFTGAPVAGSTEPSD